MLREMPPKVSVIIPVYNVAPYLEECLDSVLSQSLQNIEIICVDDASTDSSPRILECYKNKDTRINVISCTVNRGLPHARNLGLEQANGRYIYFVDSDDMIKPGALNELYDIAERDLLDLICFEAEIIYETKELAIKYPYIIPPQFKCEGIMKGKDFFIKSMKHEHWPRTVWRQFWRHQYLQRNNLHFLDEAIVHEDVIFTFQAVPNVTRMRYIDKKLYIYRRRKGSIVTAGIYKTRFVGQSVCCARIFDYCNRYLPLEDKELTEAYKTCFKMELRSWRTYWGELLRLGQNPSMLKLDEPLADLLCSVMFTSKYHFINHSFPANIYDCLNAKKVIIYGAGGVGRETKQWMQEMGLTWDYIAVTNQIEARKNNDVRINVISDLTPICNDSIVLIAARPPHSSDMLAEAKRLGFEHCILMVV